MITPDPNPQFRFDHKKAILFLICVVIFELMAIAIIAYCYWPAKGG